MDVIAGTVIEVQVKVDRMYLLVDTEKNQQWAAIDILQNQTIEAGDVVTIEGVVMKDFHIKGMKKQFGRILFGALVEADTSTRKTEKRKKEKK